MSSDHALALIYGLLTTTMYVAGPILAAALLGGVLVSIIQTATQVNEASISFIVKVGAVLAVLVVGGPVLAEKVVSYTRNSIASIEDVVR